MKSVCVTHFKKLEQIRSVYQDSFNDLKNRSETLGLTLTSEYMAAVNKAGSDVRESFSTLLGLFLNAHQVKQQSPQTKA